MARVVINETPGDSVQDVFFGFTGRTGELVQQLGDALGVDVLQFPVAGIVQREPHLPAKAL